MKIMPNCRDIIEQASDHRERQLPFLSRLGYRLHLLMCTYCRQQVKQLDITISTLKRLDPDAMQGNEEDTRKIVERLKRQALKDTDRP